MPLGTLFNSDKRSQQGNTLVLVAVAIMVLFAMAALSVDMGVLYTARTSAQHAADAGALAGARTFLSGFATQPTAAVSAAVTTANSNKVLGSPITITDSDVVVDTTLQRVTVTVPLAGASAVSTYFARVIGWNSVTVAARATAEASPTAYASRCLKPFYVPNTVLSGKNSAGEACAANPPEKIFNPDGNFSPWYKANYAGNINAAGAPMNIRPITSRGAQEAGLPPSAFYSVDFCRSLGGTNCNQGGDTYGCTIGGCLDACGLSPKPVTCGDSFWVQTGLDAGNTRHGVETLIGNPKDIWGGVDEGGPFFYPGGDKSIKMDSSRAVALAPVWDNCNSTVQPGNQAIPIAGYVVLFIEGMNSNTVTARFLGAESCYTAGGGSLPGGGGIPTGPLAKPVYLVNTSAIF